MGTTQERHRNSKLFRSNWVLQTVCGTFFIALRTVDSVDPKGIKFEWDEKCEQSCQELENRLITAPILNLLTIGAEYVMFSDASRQGLGCVLM